MTPAFGFYEDNQKDRSEKKENLEKGTRTHLADHEKNSHRRRRGRLQRSAGKKYSSAGGSVSFAAGSSSMMTRCARSPASDCERDCGVTLGLCSF